MRGGRALCHSGTDRWGIMGNMPRIIKDSTGHNERLWGGWKKLPGRHHLTAVQKQLLVSEWFSLHPWSLYLLLHSWVSDRCALAKTFGLPESKTESFLSLIWVNDIFTRLHHRRMVHRGTSISATAKADWVSRLSQRVLLSICNTPLWVTLSKSLKPDNLILLYGHVFVFHTHWRGRFSRSKVERKDNTLKSFSDILSQQRRGKRSKKKKKKMVHFYTTSVRIWGLECGLHGLLSWIHFWHFHIWCPAFIKINSCSVPSPAEKLNSSSQFRFPSTWPALNDRPLQSLAE